VAALLRKSWEVVKAPRVQIALYGDSQARMMYDFVNSPHPRFPIFRNKVWGVALLRLPESLGSYLQGKSRQTLRTMRRRSASAGYRYGLFESRRHAIDILAINRSLTVRQGRPMAISYTDSRSVASLCDTAPTMGGVFSPDGDLVAYADTITAGDVFFFNMLLGHGAHLRAGIMYMLVSEIMRDYMEIRDRRGAPGWAQYDTFWGARPGLAQFKKHLGFHPYRVKWLWRDTPSGQQLS
jgi:hypothetical protein